MIKVLLIEDSPADAAHIMELLCEVDREGFAITYEVCVEEALRRLEALLHPLVRRREDRFLGLACRRGVRLAGLDIPLLFETGAEMRCDAVIVVSAPRFVQELRVLKRPGMTRDRLAAIRVRQVPEEEKKRRADFIVRAAFDKVKSDLRQTFLGQQAQVVIVDGVVNTHGIPGRFVFVTRHFDPDGTRGQVLLPRGPAIGEDISLN